MFVKFSQPHTSHMEVCSDVTRKTGERGRALWPRRGPDQLECEGSRARGPALRESPSPRLWKKLWHRGGWAASATQAACAQTLCITRWEPGRPGRGRRLRGEQRGGRGRAPGGGASLPTPRRLEDGAPGRAGSLERQSKVPRASGPTRPADASPRQLLWENILPQPRPPATSRLEGLWARGSPDRRCLEERRREERKERRSL